MDDQQSKATLYKNLAAVMGAMKRVPKDGMNKFHGYQYATAADVADAIRGELASHNIAFFAEMLEAEIKDGVWEVTFEFTFACGETGATVAKRWRSEAQAMNNKGRDDKGLNKAATAAEKYFLLKTFIVSTGDEPDPDADGTTSPKANTLALTSWTRDEQKRWYELRLGEGLSQVDILTALGVKALGEWQGTMQSATETVEKWLERQIATNGAGATP